MSLFLLAKLGFLAQMATASIVMSHITMDLSLVTSLTKKGGDGGETDTKKCTPFLPITQCNGHGLALQARNATGAVALLPQNASAASATMEINVRL